jgi:regulatory protein
VSERALELAYRYLSRRERTRAEVRRHLLGRGLDEPDVDGALDELAAQGYVDDRRFARLFVEDKRELERWGAERIRRALAARGIERELADAALGAPGRGELDRALDLLGRRFPTAAGRTGQDGRQRERMLGVLLRKGYEPELALEALRLHQQALRLLPQA